MLFVTEGGLYDVILRSDSPKSHPFRKWVTNDVLPSIRKNGGYILNQDKLTNEELQSKMIKVYENIISDKDRQLDEKQQRILELQSVMKDNAYKIDAYDSMIDTKGLISLRCAAGLLSMGYREVGRTNLIKKLIKLNIFALDSYPTQETLDSGWFQNVWRPTEDTPYKNLTPYFTYKGLDVIIKIFNKNNKISKNEKAYKLF